MNRINLLVNWMLAAALSLSIGTAIAAPPQTINYQGYLTDSSGQPITGTLSMVFGIYAASSGGSPIWSEAQSGISVANGVFNVVLGTVNPIDTAIVPFDAPYWLGVKVGSDPEMSPRRPLTSVPYAFNAVNAATASVATSANSVSGSATIAGSQITGPLSASTIATLDSRYTNVTTRNSKAVLLVGNSGNRPSLSIAADGNPLGSYVSATGLGLFRCSTVTCGTGYGIGLSVDASVNPSSQYHSLAIAPDGAPLVAYNSVGGALRLLKCPQSVAGTCINPSVTTVDSSANVGLWNSLAIGADGFPVISYYDGTNSHLKVAKCANSACTSQAAASPATVDSANGAGQWSTIAIGADGNPFVAYIDQGSLSLKVLKCGNAACTSGNSISVLDSVAPGSGYVSIAVGIDGAPIISYYTGQLKVAKCGNSSCSSGNVVTTVDAGGNVGTWTSISIGSDAMPVIAYRDETNSTLKFVKCGGATCSFGNIVLTLDSDVGAGSMTSMAIGVDGAPVIAYNNQNAQTLMLFKCGAPDCQPGAYFWRR